jgi:hypothetical protein
MHGTLPHLPYVQQGAGRPHVRVTYLMFNRELVGRMSVSCSGVFRLCKESGDCQVKLGAALYLCCSMSLLTFAYSSMPRSLWFDSAGTALANALLKL